LRKNRVEIGNSGLLFFVANHEEKGSLKNCAESAFSLTAALLAISLTILSLHGFAQTQMVLVTTGSTTSLAVHLATARHLLEVASHRPVFIVPFEVRAQANAA